MPIKILSNYSDKNSKLTKQGHGIVQWRAGSNQEEIKASCNDANCLFLKGGAFMNPVDGTIIPGKKIVTIPGTSMSDPIYNDSKGNQLMKVDSCFAISGTPYLASYRMQDDPRLKGIEGLKRAINNAPRKADRARGAVVGNASTVMSKEELEEVDTTIRQSLKHHILYDHAWRKNPWVLDHAVASCNHIADIRAAISMGASVCSVVLPQNIIDQYRGKKVEGFHMTQCPENVSPKINCINCGGKSGPLCDAKTRSNLVIMFQQHGGNSWKRQKKAIMGNIAKNATPDEPTTGDKSRDKRKRKIRVSMTLEKLQKAIKQGDRQTIVTIAENAMQRVSKATAKKYRKFLEVTCE